MAAEYALNFEALESQAATLMESFKAAGFEQVAPSIIQPADIFLDRIGESLRGRTYVFTDLSGEELCLRPDLTVPVSRLYLERHPDAQSLARYCYNGPAFRYQPFQATGVLMHPNPPDPGEGDMPAVRLDPDRGIPMMKTGSVIAWSTMVGSVARSWT